MKDTRDRIIMQALTYFTGHDYDRISLNDIAGALGITKGGIYHYFGSKDELFKETLLFTVEKLEQEFNGLTDAYIREDPAMPLEKVLRLFFNIEAFGDRSEDSVGVDVYREYENLVYLLFVGLKKFPELRTRIAEIYDGQINRLADLFDRAQHNGEMRKDIDTRIIAFEIIALVEGSLLVGSLTRGNSLGELSSGIFENTWRRIGIEIKGEP